MYNGNNKGVLMEENPQRVDWHGTFAPTKLTDHTAKGIARPNTLDLVMHLYAPDLEKFKTWTPPKAEKIK